MGRENFDSEIYWEETSSRSIGWADGKPQVQSTSEDCGACVRVIKDGSQGVAVSKGYSEQIVNKLIDQAQETAAYLPADSHRLLYQKKTDVLASIPMDLTFGHIPSQEILDRLAQVESNILKTDPRLKKFIKMNWAEQKSHIHLQNSFGISSDYESSAFTFVVELLAEDKGQTEVGWDFRSVRFGKDLNLEKMAQNVASHTLESLGGRPIASGVYPVLVHPRVGIQLLSLVENALSAEAVQLGRSFWRNLKGSVVASPVVHLSDDPLMLDGVASCPFDDEGVPHENLDVVSNGVLHDYFYDLHSARKEGRESNGRAFKESLGALAKPAASNFFLKPGNHTYNSFLESQSTIFYLHDVMGLHMADPITGEFSLGASGSLYRRGKFDHAVRGVTIAGTIGEIFKKITGIGNDLTWYGSMGAPHFLIDSITVAGL